MLLWGANFWGQLGDGTFTIRNMPVAVVGLSGGVASVSAGGLHTCAATATGGLKCWGDNGFGALGDGTTVRRTTPVGVVTLPSGVASVAAGNYHTCVLTEAGSLKCWGYNSSGQLGHGAIPERLTPVDVVALPSGVASVAAGSNHTCAVTTAGGLKCWGINITGGLGDGTLIGTNAPVDVVGLTSGVAAVAGASGHTCAVTSVGGLKCWGQNRNGELGDGTLTHSTTPVYVVGLTSGVSSVSALKNHTCAVTTAGGLKCFGAGTSSVSWGMGRQRTAPRPLT